MLDKMLAFLINYIKSFAPKIERSVLNTTDTWIPVWCDGSNILQHRVIPSNADSNCIKFGNIWTDGAITLKRRGNIVQVDGTPVLSAVNARSQIATIPAGFRPVDTAYVQINGINDFLLFNPNGTVQCNARGTGRIYFSGTWAVD